MSTALLDTMTQLEATFSRFQLLRSHKAELQRKVERRAIREASLLRSAFSAESIVARILSQRGWTKKWRGGDLSGKQHLSLLEDCRLFGRARLRHEAETLFEMHGVEDEPELLSSVANRARNTGDPGDILQRRIYQDSVGDLGSQERSISSRAAGAVGRFFRRSKQFIHELITAGAMLLKGDEPLTTEEILAVDRQAAKQHEFLDGFEREVRANPPREISDLSSQIINVLAPPMSADQFTARIESYGNSVWQGAQQANRVSSRKTGNFVKERRILGNPATGHCLDCPPISYSQTGWVDVGTLPDIGDTECNGKCLCHFEYQDSTGRVFVGTPKTGAGPKLKRIPNPPQAKTSEPPHPEPQPTKTDPIPAKVVPKPEPAKSDNYPPARPIPSIEEIIEEAGSPHSVEYYEEI